MAVPSTGSVSSRPTGKSAKTEGLCSCSVRPLFRTAVTGFWAPSQMCECESKYICEKPGEKSPYVS